MQTQSSIQLQAIKRSSSYLTLPLRNRRLALALTVHSCFCAAYWHCYSLFLLLFLNNPSFSLPGHAIMHDEIQYPNSYPFLERNTIRAKRQETRYELLLTVCEIWCATVSNEVGNECYMSFGVEIGRCDQ